MVRFGILGAGNIAHRFAASLSHEPRAHLVAAACRTKSKAEEFLGAVAHAQHASAYGNYDELLANPSIDAIYLALPHAHHREWAIQALMAGKAVLCEKPAMVSAVQMSEVASVARSQGLLFMEAMKPRFTPLYRQVLLALHRIDPIVRVEATLCNDMLDFVEAQGSYHMTPGPGAGVLLDCGTYCASWVCAFCPGELELVSIADKHKNGIDVYVDAELTNGLVTARLECAFDRAKPRTATLVGKGGSIVVEELHRPERATLYVSGEQPQMLDAPYEVDDFFGEIRHFVDLLETGATESPVMPLDDSVSCAATLDLVRSSFVTSLVENAPLA